VDIFFAFSEESSRCAVCFSGLLLPFSFNPDFFFLSVVLELFSFFGFDGVFGNDVCADDDDILSKYESFLLVVLDARDFFETGWGSFEGFIVSK